MRWYEEKLGLRPLMDLGVSGQLRHSGGVFWLIYQTPSAATGKHTLVGWVVASIDDAMRDLRAKGVVFEDYDLGDQGPTTQIGVARGPDGGAAAGSRTPRTTSCRSPSCRPGWRCRAT